MQYNISREELVKSTREWTNEIPSLLVDVGLAEMDPKNKRTLTMIIGLYLRNAYGAGYDRGYAEGYDDGDEDGYSDGRGEGYDRGRSDAKQDEDDSIDGYSFLGIFK